MIPLPPSLPWGDEILGTWKLWLEPWAYLSSSPHRSPQLSYITGQAWTASFFTEPPPHTFQFSCIFILTASFSCVGEFSSGFRLWGSMHSQRYLAHLHDGIFTAVSPILKKTGEAYTVAEMNEKCQDVHLFVSFLGPPPPQTISWLSLKCDIYLSKVNLSPYDVNRKCHNWLQNKINTERDQW